MKIGFIGAGNMGGAYIKALKNHEIYFIENDANREEEIKAETNAKPLHELKDLIKSVEIIVIAIKPQILDQILKEIAKMDLKNKLIISLVVGVRIFHYKKILGDSIKFVRVMPNTPSLIGKGICGYTTYNLEEIDEINTKIVLEATGKALEVEENKLDMITAISGSGPAYVFMLINAFADGGVKIGLSKKEAIELASETFIGAASMIMETGMHPEILKDMVTSPGGTTAEGLSVMEEEKVRNAMIKTAEATFRKAKELGNKEE